VGSALATSTSRGASFVGSWLRYSLDCHDVGGITPHWGEWKYEVVEGESGPIVQLKAELYSSLEPTHPLRLEEEEPLEDSFRMRPFTSGELALHCEKDGGEMRSLFVAGENREACYFERWNAWYGSTPFQREPEGRFDENFFGLLRADELEMGRGLVCRMELKDYDLVETGKAR